MKNACGGFFITGTDTDVGKTVFASVLGAILRKKGYGCAHFKPVQSGADSSGGPDIHEYRKFGAKEVFATVCLKPPQAPLIAARLERKKVQIEKLLSSFYILTQKHRNLLIEGAGGVIVPITKKMLMADLAKSFGLPVVIVARPELGTINHTCLTAAYLKARGIRIAGIVFSGVRQKDVDDFLPISNEIKRISGVSLLGYLERFDFAKDGLDKVLRRAEKTLKLRKIHTFLKK